MHVTSERIFREAGRLGLLRDGIPYSKALLLGALSGAGLEAAHAERVFVQVRALVKHGGRSGGLVVRAVGERRGRKYLFEGLPTSDGRSTETADSSGASTARFVSPTPAPSRPARRPAPAPPPLGASSPGGLGKPSVYFGDNLPILRELPSGAYDLIYIDPPFNTGKVQARTRTRTVRDSEGGDRTGFQGRRYRTVKVGTASFADVFTDFLEFMEPRLVEAHRLLKPTGSFFLHIDYREVHYCKILLDQIFGRDSFLNEIIWAYDYGARSKKRWSAKHDNVLWYAKDPRSYTFNYDEMDRIPYMAPGLVGKEKAARGKTPTDVWWHTIVPTNGKERTGYPTQKPLGILNRILKVHTRRGDRVLDFFAGSGTTGESAVRLGRDCTLIDNNVEAMRVMARRLAFATPVFSGWQEPETEQDSVSAAVALS